MDVMIDKKPMQKREIDIARGDGTFQESLAIAHTSAVGTSKSNECMSSYSFYDATVDKDKTGCWAHDDSKKSCVIANPDCLKLEVNETRM